ncbi:MAG: hypothetical protein ACLUFI_07730 [Oscillospiraceae bacterium]
MEPLFLPVLHSFENNNIFTGSFGALRFRVTPSIVMLEPERGQLRRKLHEMRVLARRILLRKKPDGR